MTPNWMMETAGIVEKEEMNTFELAMECSRNARNHQTAQPLVLRLDGELPYDLFNTCDSYRAIKRK